MQKWEYLYIRDDGQGQYVNGQKIRDAKNAMPIWELANHYGEQGWEPVAAPYTQAGSGNYKDLDTRLIFKRPKP